MGVFGPGGGGAGGSGSAVVVVGSGTERNGLGNLHPPSGKKKAKFGVKLTNIALHVYNVKGIGNSVIVPIRVAIFGIALERGVDCSFHTVEPPFTFHT